MKRKWIWILIGIIILMCLVNSKSNKQESKEIIQISPTEIPKNKETKNLVTKVIDGDTVVVKIGEEEKVVRMIGIDAPETDEFGSQESTEELKKLIENKEIILENDESQEDMDIYDRILRYVILDGININQKMIEDGWAKEYTYKVVYKYQKEFKEAENIAKENKKGVWGEIASPTDIPKTTPIKEKIMGVKSQQNTDFVCDCSKTCTQITTCDEAYFQLDNCGCKVRDNDSDGIPCESLCR